MDAIITGENGRTGLSVIDNNDVEHLIEMNYSGDILYHGCEEYADNATNRTRKNTEYGAQARRYAKWYVYRERGYETLPRRENPDCIAAGMLAIAALSESDVEQEFAALRDQLRSHYDDREVEIPFDDGDGENVVYRQDIYLEPDPMECEPPVLEQYQTAASDHSDSVGDLRDGGSDIDSLLDRLREASNQQRSLPSFDIEAVSDLHYLQDRPGTRQTHFGATPIDRDPDARLELIPVQVDDFGSYKLFLVSHLANQIRDYFLLMGCSPPEPFRIQGLGTYEGMVKQQLLDMYDEYFLAGSPVNSWDPS